MSFWMNFSPKFKVVICPAILWSVQLFIKSQLPHSCTHLTCKQSNAQNSLSQASTVYELWTSRCSSWIYKLPISVESLKKQESSRKTSTSALLTMPKPLCGPQQRKFKFSSVQFSPVTQSCLTLCDPMNRSMPGLPIHHQLLEFTQTHVHRVDDAIQPSYPLASPSPPAPNPSQLQGLFQ